MANTALQMLKTPSRALGDISANPRRYFASSAVILAILFGLVSHVSYTDHVATPAWESWQEPNAVALAMLQFQAVASDLLWFVTVFYIGRRLGGTLSFGRIFAVLSHCMIPHILMLVPFLFVNINDLGVMADYFDDDDGDNTSFSFNTPGVFFIPSVALFVALPFIVWSVVLAVKALMIANGFGIRKSLGILGLSAAATHALMLLYNITFGVLSQMYLWADPVMDTVENYHLPIHLFCLIP